MTGAILKKFAAAASVVFFFLITCAEANSVFSSTYSIKGNYVIWYVEEKLVWRFPKASAAEISELSNRFNNIYRAGFKLEDLHVEKTGASWSVLVGKKQIYSMTRDYAASVKQDPQKMALQMLSRLYEALGERSAAKLTPEYQIRGKYDISAAVSWYGGKFIGKKFANGERFTSTHLTAAAKNLPFGTLVKVTARSGKSVVVRVTDRFKEHKNRVLDVSHAAAELLGIKGSGETPVRIKVIGRVDKIGGIVP
jgi:rare lipoprotein A